MAVTLCVLLWARLGREVELVAYEDEVLGLLAEHGGRALQRVRPTGGRNDPTEVQLIEFPSEAAFEGFMADERRAAMADRRDEAIEKTEVVRVGGAADGSPQNRTEPAITDQ